MSDRLKRSDDNDDGDVMRCFMNRHQGHHDQHHHHFISLPLSPFVELKIESDVRVTIGVPV